MAAIVGETSAQTPCPPGSPPAYIDSVASEVNVTRAGGADVEPVLDLPLCPGDEVVTGKTGRVAIRFDDKRTVVRLDGNSRTRILSAQAAEGDLSLLSGVLLFLSSVPTHFQVDTPYIVAGIEGTEALVGVDPAESLAITAVREGFVSAYDRQAPTGPVTVAPGEAAFRSATVAFQKAPISKVPPQFRDLLIVSTSSVDWAVYYPPIMFAEDTPDEHLRRAVELLSSGEYEQASAELDASTADLALSAALRTIIEIGRDRLAEAHRWSEQALAADPASAQANIAASYVRQATGDLAGSLGFAATAAELAPGDAYVLARLAELQMTIGDRRAAMATAAQSLAIERTPLALFVAGLATLVSARYETAEALFREAIALESQAPLPRLGLGLAYIRRGRTSAGSWEIERAIAHDPRRAWLRNWLGRAYFDEGLGHKAAEQFRLSKQADPEDPTPYLFSALQRYAANSPIVALRELYDADARARARSVVRSQRGLGEDLATLGAAQGRIYDTLGLEQLAVLEGAGAADADPSNPGAHRFLAEAHRAMAGYEMAQTSQLLRSQLLSPPSKTPVQPQLAEADLGLLETTGPARVSFAEFAPLFDADGLRADLSGLLGTQHTWANEASVTGLYRNASISVGKFHYSTDGFRANNDLRHEIFDSVATLAITPELSLFGEYRVRKTEGGDRLINFDIDRFDPTLRSRFERTVARAGFHAEPSTDTDLIGLYTHASVLARDDFQPFPDLSDFRQSEDQSHNPQIQHIWQGSAWRNVAGAQYVTNDRTNEFSFLGGVNAGRDTSSSRSLTAYEYLYVDFPTSVTWTIGGSVSTYETLGLKPGQPTFDAVEFLPKLGVIVEVSDQLRLRAAYFRSLKPDLVSEQLIEPTTIAGFRQFGDVFNGSLLEQAGAGLDARLTDSVLLGAEGAVRWISVPFSNAAQPETEETLVQGYAAAILSDHWIVSAELIHERSASDDAFNDFAHWRVTSLPLTLSYFGETGLFGTLGPEFVDHDFEGFGERGADNFALVNASLGFRLPNGRGLLSVEARNLLDQDFSFQNRTRRPDIAAEPRFAPERTIMARGTMRF